MQLRRKGADVPPQVRQFLEYGLVGRNVYRRRRAIEEPIDNRPCFRQARRHGYPDVSVYQGVALVGHRDQPLLEVGPPTCKCNPVGEAVKSLLKRQVFRLSRPSRSDSMDVLRSFKVLCRYDLRR